jgi:hypothetical protein
MNTRVAILLGVLLVSSTGRAEDKAPPAEAMKKTARENWERVGAGPMVEEATEHFFLIAPKSAEGKLKEWGAQLEKAYELAAKTLYTPKDTPIKGVMAIYFLPEQEKIATFYRRILKRRPLGHERGAFSVEDDKMFVVIGPQQDSSDPTVDVQALQQVASAMLQKRAGAKTILPHWLVNGFGRATWYRLNLKPTDINRERMTARSLFAAKKRTVQDIWNGGLEGDEPGILEPSLADFFAYGPGKMKFLALLEAFRPGENEEMKTIDQALQAVELKVDLISKAFKQFINLPN